MSTGPHAEEVQTEAEEVVRQHEGQAVGESGVQRRRRPPPASARLHTGDVIQVTL